MILVVSQPFVVVVSLFTPNRCSTLTRSPPDIDMLSEEYVVVDPGSSVELSCSVKNYTQVSLLWYKDGNNVPVGDPTFTYSELVLTSTLTIQSVQNGDLGEYRCGIDASRSRKSSSVSSVSVNAVEDIVLRGSGAATLRCDLTGSSSQPSSVIWTGKFFLFGLQYILTTFKFDKSKKGTLSSYLFRFQ